MNSSFGRSSLRRRTALLHRSVVALLLFLVPPITARAQTSPHGTMPYQCEECHSPASWKTMTLPSKFDHAKTGFALTGQHAVAQCTKCHTNLKFAVAGKRCADCHKDMHRSQLGAACERCHTPGSWLVSDMIQRHAKTRFALVGAHATANCEQCHRKNQKNEYAGLRTDCNGCHQTDYANAKSPNHRTAGFSTDCASCHRVNAVRWGGSFDHAQTGFPLVGAHAATPCAQCHVGSNFKGMSAQCIGCHRQRFTTAASPTHTGFSTDCVTCHTMSGWRPASFDHNTKTTFRLTGAHMATPCQECHKNAVYKGTSTVCYSCHQQQFITATNPRHTGFPTDCVSCHGTAGWRPASFDHKKTNFQLTGAHQAVACNQCHKNSVYAGTPATCFACHQANYQNVANPKHAPGFPTDCLSCHTTAAWRPASFDHNKASFQLTGAHQAVACTQCHKNNVYAGTPATCFACHQTDYQNVTNPKHAPGFSTDCLTCHATTAWQPAKFDHAKANFQLTGAHVTTPCASCHKNGIYSGTPNTCGNSACHLTRYNATTNPRHLSAGFPMECQPCHSTTAWTPSTFNHDQFFPISAGSKHSPGRWTLCADCHTVPTNFTLFSCIDCHKHQPKSVVDGQHQGKTGYSYTSAACYKCHPRGTH